MINTGSTMINSLIGGSIMSLATSLHLYLQGKITGISGICYKCLTRKDFDYNISFISGMIFISSLIKCFFHPISKNMKPGAPTFLETTSKYVEDLSLLGFILAGFLVGFGAKMANGCTSGHGICGLPRLSKRSFIAIAFFMIFGAAIATLKHYFEFLRPISYATQVWEYDFINYFILLISIIIFLFYLCQAFSSNQLEKVRDIIVSFIIGILFSYGLIQSGMIQRHVVIEFLTIAKIWNIQLLFVLGSAVGINFFTFNYILKKINKPRNKESFDLPTKTNVDFKLILGSAIFGLGWGLGGICPGPAIIGFYAYCPQILLFIVFMCLGILIESTLDKKMEASIDSNPNLNKANRTKNISGLINNENKNTAAPDLY